MRLNPLLFSVGLTASLCSVCQTGTEAAPPYDTTTKVVALAAGFNAVRYRDCDVKGNPCDNPPAVGVIGTVPAMPGTAVSDIQAAFNIAPGFFQQELCITYPDA